MSKKDITRLNNTLPPLIFIDNKYKRDATDFALFSSLWQRLLFAPILLHLWREKVSINEFVQVLNNSGLTSYTKESLNAVSHGHHRNIDIKYFYFMYRFLQIPYPTNIEEVVKAFQEVEASRQAKRDKIAENKRLRAAGLKK